MIVAIDKNNGIGKNNDLLVHIKEDLQYFKKITDGHTIVMGYNTWLSLPFKPLKNRHNIVLTSKNIQLDGATVINGIEPLLRFLGTLPDKEVFIIGGASLYNQMLNYADRLYVTHIFEDFNADTFFPEINDEWEITKISAEKCNIKHEHPHIYTIYEKVKGESNVEIEK
jgi:dihydrofolate reductase